MATLHKYPRTLHLPWSLGATVDDRILSDTSCFEGKEIVITEKCDGENSNLYHDYYHARSLDSKPHPSRTWLKNYHASFKQDIPEGWRICGENMFAKHSIRYENLPSYFLVFSIWNEQNICLSWDETVEWANLLGLDLVPVLWRGIWDEKVVRDRKILEGQEGYVVRLARGFNFEDFALSTGKMVRASHVQTDEHWMNKPVEVNGLSKTSRFYRGSE
jgi:hypothetical protein